MDQDETWHTSRPRPWPHRVRWRHSSPPPKRVRLSEPPIISPCLLWPNGRPSRLLLSTCLVMNRTLSVTLHVSKLLPAASHYPFAVDGKTSDSSTQRRRRPVTQRLKPTQNPHNLLSRTCCQSTDGADIWTGGVPLDKLRVENIRRIMLAVAQRLGSNTARITRDR